MEGQMSIFDFPEWLPESQKQKYMPIIQKLDDEVRKICEGYEIDEAEYEVWEHVPNLGKRYCVWINDVINDDLVRVSRDLRALIDRYKRFDLEISICGSPGKEDEKYNVIAQNIMVSTMWKSKGHKEPKLACPYVESCSTFAIGCSGINYWCNRF